MNVTREELRQKLLAGADKLHGMPIIWNHMSPEEQTLSLCGRQLWATDDAVTNAALDNFVALVNARGG